MRVLWVCNIMLPVIAQALSQEYSVREGWLSGILGRYLETENGAELSAADGTALYRPADGSREPKLRLH